MGVGNMEEEKLQRASVIPFNFRFAIGWDKYEIDLAKAYKLLKPEHFVKYEPEFSRGTMSVWNDKLKINLCNSGYCKIWSKTENEQEIKLFLESIRKNLLLARAKR